MEYASETSLRRTFVRKLNQSCLQLTVGLGLVLIFAPMSNAAAQPQIRKQPFGTTTEKKPVDLYTLTNSNGLEVGIMTYGGIVVSLKVPDRNGKLQEVTLGYDTL